MQAQKNSVHEERASVIFGRLALNARVPDIVDDGKMILIVHRSPAVKYSQLALKWPSGNV